MYSNNVYCAQLPPCFTGAFFSCMRRCLWEATPVCWVGFKLMKFCWTKLNPGNKKWTSFNLNDYSESLNKQVFTDCWMWLSVTFTAVLYSWVTDDWSRRPVRPGLLLTNVNRWALHQHQSWVCSGGRGNTRTQIFCSPLSLCVVLWTLCEWQKALRRWLQRKLMCLEFPSFFRLFSLVPKCLFLQ